ncbi:cytochrome b/b6 domain-containing protein, partial [Azotobacter chroococcum]|nr:cytochrome b/b6 domain-containing protein [Azotobacter chroococcum]
MSDSIKVWDAPLRLFHWSLALAVGAAMLSGWLGGNLMVWHGRLGLLILGLLAFRLLWGLLGSTYARWSRILAAPLRLGDYLRGRWRQAGHNPLGALSVLALLGLAAFQVLTGLTASDDIAFQGQLYRL